MQLPPHPNNTSTLRKSTVEFLHNLGHKLELPQLTIATGDVYYHRFFEVNRSLDPERHMVAPSSTVPFSEDDFKSGMYTLSSMIALAGLFLATKVEETPRRLRDIIDKAHEMHKLVLDPTSAKYNAYRAEILTCEKSLLQTIAFDLTVEHPYKFILTFMKRIKGEKDVAQTAWNFVNDSLKTTLSLYSRPQVIAMASIQMAANVLKERDRDRNLPPRVFFDEKEFAAVMGEIGCGVDEVRQVSNRILEVYPQTQLLATLGQSPGSLGGQSPGGALAAGSLTPTDGRALSTCNSPYPSQSPGHVSARSPAQELSASGHSHRAPFPGVDENRSHPNQNNNNSSSDHPSSHRQSPQRHHQQGHARHPHDSSPSRSPSREGSNNNKRERERGQGRDPDEPREKRLERERGRDERASDFRDIDRRQEMHISQQRYPSPPPPSRQGPYQPHHHYHHQQHHPSHQQHNNHSPPPRSRSPTTRHYHDMDREEKERSGGGGYLARDDRRDRPSSYLNQNPRDYLAGDGPREALPRRDRSDREREHHHHGREHQHRGEHAHRDEKLSNSKERDERRRDDRRDEERRGEDRERRDDTRDLRDELRRERNEDRRDDRRRERDQPDREGDRERRNDNEKGRLPDLRIEIAGDMQVETGQPGGQQETRRVVMHPAPSRAGDQQQQSGGQGSKPPPRFNPRGK